MLWSEEKEKAITVPANCGLAVSWESAEKNTIVLQLEMLFSKDCQASFFL